MKTKISIDNPFGPIDHGFLWEHVNKGRHLDFGCYDGKILRILLETNRICEGVGVDRNAEVIRASEQGAHENLRLFAITDNHIPFPDKHFDSASIIGVIEHLANPDEILDELSRVLKNDAQLIVAVPGRHFFSFLDMGNFKFIFPRLHRIYFELAYGKPLYRERYIDCKNGLFGDIEIGKMWHEHYSHEQLTKMIHRAGFTVVTQDGYGFFTRPLKMLSHASPRVVKPFFQKLMRRDRIQYHKTEIVQIAVKSIYQYPK